LISQKKKKTQFKLRVNDDRFFIFCELYANKASKKINKQKAIIFSCSNFRGKIKDSFAKSQEITFWHTQFPL